MEPPRQSEINDVSGAFDEILASAQANAGWAFERLFHAYAAPVAGYLRAQGAEDPDGLANEVFFGAFRGIGSFVGDNDQFRSWLFTIAHNRLVDDRRRRGRRPETAELGDVDGAGGDVESEALARLGTETVNALLSELVPDQRDVLLLRLVGDFTVDQAAEIVGKRPGAVKALQRRGLEALRRRIAEQGVPL